MKLTLTQILGLAISSWTAATVLTIVSAFRAPARDTLLGWILLSLALAITASMTLIIDCAVHRMAAMLEIDEEPVRRFSIVD